MIDSLEKLKKKCKDTDVALDTLRKDNIMMRQDLSVFQANAEDKLDVNTHCDKMVMTIKMRVDRLNKMIEYTEPQL